MTGVIYARYSSDNQREESIEGQLRECYAYAEKQGITIVGEYIDRALSAKTDKRPQFQQLIKDSGNQRFDTVLVWKFDRFARNRFDSANYKYQLRKNGVKLVSATEVISEGSEGILLESVLEGMAEYYSVELAEKVTRGMTENALKCKFNGGVPPIGYVINKDRHFEIDPLKAPWVLEAFKWYSKGKTIKNIVALLNEKGLTTSLGTPITVDIVTDMLKNRRYIGEYRFQNIVQENGIPAIVPKDLFDKVQAALAKNKKAAARHKAEDDYLLTTKLFCGKCGVYMCGESGTGKNGTVHRYYKCNNAKYKHSCDKKSVKKDWIESLVIRHTKELVMQDAVIEDIANIVLREANAESKAIQLLQRQLKETKRRIANLLSAMEEGITTKATRQRLIELEESKEEIELKITKEEMHRPKLTKEGLIFWLQRFRSMDVTKKEHSKRLIDSFVNAIYLYDDKLVLIFNYENANKTVTLNEVNGSIIECSTVPKIPDVHFGHLEFFMPGSRSRKGVHQWSHQCH